MLPVPPQAKYSQDDYAADVQAARQRLQSFGRASMGAVNPEHDPEYGVLGGVHPHLEILKWAESKAVDAIIMGSHTTTNHGSWYPGSAVERVSFRSRCPVMVVTDPTALNAWDDAAPEKGLT
jgi:nucleotide-binding universal stress UspA family protein